MQFLKLFQARKQLLCDATMQIKVPPPMESSNTLEQASFSTRYAPLAAPDSTTFLACACIAWVAEHEEAVAITMDYNIIHSACSCGVCNHEHYYLDQDAQCKG